MNLKELLADMERKTKLGLYEGPGRAVLLADIRNVGVVYDATTQTHKRPELNPQAAAQLDSIVRGVPCHE